MNESPVDKYKAAEIMGVPAVGQAPEDTMNSFSHDILKIEMAGPEHEHFSVIDLPGLFRSKESTAISSIC